MFTYLSIYIYIYVYIYIYITYTYTKTHTHRLSCTHTHTYVQSDKGAATTADVTITPAGSRCGAAGAIFCFGAISVVRGGD